MQRTSRSAARWPWHRHRVGRKGHKEENAQEMPAWPPRAAGLWCSRAPAAGNPASALVLERAAAEQQDEPFLVLLTAALASLARPSAYPGGGTNTAAVQRRPCVLAPLWGHHHSTLLGLSIASPSTLLRMTLSSPLPAQGPRRLPTREDRQQSMPLCALGPSVLPPSTHTYTHTHFLRTMTTKLLLGINRPDKDLSSQNYGFCNSHVWI